MDVLFSASLVALIFSASKSACAESSIDTGATAAIMKELSNLRSHVLSLEDKVMQQEQDMSLLQHQVIEYRAITDSKHGNRLLKRECQRHDVLLSQIRNDIQELQSSDRDDKRTIEILKGKIDKSNQEQKSSNAGIERIASTYEYQRTSFGCLGEVLTLTCENNRTIKITNATYGKYEYTCADQESCCPPNPKDDCTELVYENQPSDWANLKYICDNKTRCSYEYLGSIIDDCEEDYTADYMHIFFTCQPEINDEPIGFSMSATTKEYFQHEVVRFNQTLTNLGGYYNTETCSFLCPVDGIYLFTVNFNAASGFDMEVVTMIDGSGLTYPRAYSINDGYSQSSSSVITLCLAGQTVWPRCPISDAKMFDTNAKSTFSGYLLHPFV